MPGSHILLACGARAAEALLLDAVAEAAAETARDPRLLARPLRIVVPSRSLRLHVCAALVRRQGRAVAGVRVQTLAGLAQEVLDRAGEAWRGGELVFPVLVGQAARAEPALAHALGVYEDGYAVVAAEVSDLLDAGFEPAALEAWEEWLAEREPSDPRAARARALARVAAATARALHEGGLARGAERMRRARSLVEQQGQEVLPTRALWVHGFADATGVATDLLETLLRGGDAWLLLDQPPDAVHADRLDAGVVFTRRLRGRLEAAAPAEEAHAHQAPLAPRLRLLEAPGANAEVRAVAERVRARLDAGVAPEAIGVVARNLGPYLGAIRLHFARLGVPYSALGEPGPLTRQGARIRALLALLAEGPRTPAQRWLELLGPAGGAPPLRDAAVRSDLGLALDALGAARLADVVRLEPEAVCASEEGFKLPLRSGLRAPVPGAPGAPVPTAPRRRLTAEALASGVEAARRLLAHLGARPASAELVAHARWLQRLLDAHLGWRSEPAPDDAHDTSDTLLRHGLERLTQDVPLGLELTAADFTLLVRRALEDAGASRAGGAGAGVQVLSVMEARARTFEHLFALGLVRGLFPRSVDEDALLPDDLREALARDLLPDLPVKRRGYDEERFLFAQLLASAPNVDLSWQRVDDDGRPLAPSVFVEVLRRGLPELEIERAVSLHARERLEAGPTDAPRGPRPAHETLLLTGLHAGRARFGALLPVALEEAARLTQAAPDSGGIDALARARLGVLAEQDPEPARAVALGPYHGFLGTPREPADPRTRDPAVTRLERLALCPWQDFLRGILHVDAPLDALGTLPGVDPRLLGTLVHQVLERIVRAAAADWPGELPEALGRAPVRVAWPEDAVLERWLGEEAERLARSEGVALAGLSTVLVRLARPHLARVRELDWSEGPRAVLAPEVRGHATVHDEHGRARRIGFKADRADAAPEGAREGGADASGGTCVGSTLELTDYKTSRKAVSGAKSAAQRRATLIDQLGCGQWLQVAVYALAEGVREVRGRLLFSAPDLEPHTAVASLASDDAEAAEAFAGLARRALAVWDAGSFFPRLEALRGEREPRRCERCSVAPACLRSDSGARRRLVDWVGRARDEGAAEAKPGEAERALLALWLGGSRE